MFLFAPLKPSAKRLIFIHLLLPFALTHAIKSWADQIYKHVDQYGNVTYSDEPPTSSAQALELKPLNTTPATRAKPTPSAQPSLAPEPTPETATHYNLRMMSPKSDSRFGPAEKSLTVILLTNRKLQENHFFQVSIDGKVHGAATKSNSVNIELTRSLQGRRAFSAAIVDDSNSVIESTPTNTAYIIRPPIKPKLPPR